MERLPRYYDNLDDYLTNDKVLVLYGPRQVGKTTLVKSLIRNLGVSKVKYDTGDDYRVHEVWNSRNLSLLREYVHGYDVVVVDEAQRIPGIGIGLKLLVDAGTPCRLIVTGSSSFELAGQVGESLMLYPIAQLELAKHYNRFELQEKLDSFLVYGGYPEVVTADSYNQKRELLEEITGSYLLKDILELERVKSSKVLLDLLRLLAYQVGNLVSLREMGNGLGLDYKTVARYLDLMEKSFILYNVRGYSGNLRKEINKKSKYYFFDNGIRNALIANYNPVGKRDDLGALWENYIFMERMKKTKYSKISRNTYFWRTWDQQEIDIIEERECNLYAYECKYGNKQSSPPKAWREAYPSSEYSTVNLDNYLDFIL